MAMRLFTIRALIACALLMIAAPMLAQTRGSTPDRALQRASVARTIQALRVTLGRDLHIAQTRTNVTDLKEGSSRLLGSLGSITGTVTMPDAGDVATVMAVSTDGIREEILVTEVLANGTYTIDSVPAGTYLVLATSMSCATEFYDNVADPDSATHVTVGSGQVVSNIDFSLEEIGVGEGSITGKVLTDVGGDAIMGASVWAMSLSNPMAGGWAEVDPSGDFTISGLVSGEYVVQASAPGFIAEFYENAATPETATQISVREPGSTNGVIISLSPGATIAGRVLDAEGLPLSGVYVEVMPAWERNGDSIIPDFGTGAMAVTDENGYYTASGLTTGRYVVSASYWNMWFGVTEYYDNATTPEEATFVSATEGQTTGGIDFQLAIPTFDGAIAGVVRDTAGNAIESAYIMIVGSQNSFPVRASAITAADGSYVVEGLPDGQYEVVAMAQSGFASVVRWWPNAESSEQAELVSITDGECAVASVDFALPFERGTASIAGTVRLADGSPLANATVGLIIADPSDSTILFGASAITDSTGAYVLESLPAGQYLAYASVWEGDLMGMEWYLDARDPSEATPIVLGRGEARTGIDFSLEMVSYWGSLAGRVTDDRTGAPIAGAYVEIAPAGAVIMGGDEFSFGPTYAITSDDGRFAIERVPAGEYFVAVVANGAYEYYDDAQHPDSASTVTVLGSETTELAIGLTPRVLGNGSITGRVFSNDGRPMEIGIVAAFPTDGTEEVDFPAVAVGGGSYEIEGLADGDYYVFAFSPQHIGEYYEDAWDFTEATVVSIRNGQERSGVDFGLDGWGCFPPGDSTGSPGEVGGIVYGNVSDVSGKAIADANVYVVDANRRAVASVRTKADGSYEISGLPLGEGYRVMASSLGYTSEYNGDARSYEEADGMQVVRGRMQVDFELQQGVSSVRDEERASGITIAGAFPNPFVTTTTVRFSLEKQMDLDVTVVDARGTTVARLHDGVLGGGSHELRWDGRASDGTSVASGVYFVRIDNGAATRTVPVVK